MSRLSRSWHSKRMGTESACSKPQTHAPFSATSRLSCPPLSAGLPWWLKHRIFSATRTTATFFLFIPARIVTRDELCPRWCQWSSWSGGWSRRSWRPVRQGTTGTGLLWGRFRTNPYFCQYCFVIKIVFITFKFLKTPVVIIKSIEFIESIRKFIRSLKHFLKHK